MTRKEIQRLADAMHGCRITIRNGYPAAFTDAERDRDAQRIAVHRAACLALADTLATMCARFDRAAFLASCGVWI